MEVSKLFSKKKIFFALVMFLFIPSIVYGNESRLLEAPIFIDDVPINTRYLMREGHLMVPALYLKHTGTYVDWNEQYKSVVFKAKDKMFALPVGKSYSDDFNQSTGKWTRHPLPIATIDFGGEPFVPLIDVAKKLGMSVRYDPKINKTFITTNLPIVANKIETAETSEKLVALTFDDGPEDYYTPKILSILKEKGVPATFFVVGRQITYFPEIMKQIVKDGHGIANHTWYHPDLRYQWSSTVREEIISTQNEMQKVLGKKPDVFRPPYGAYTKADVAILNEIGMRNILWSVDTLDWSGMSAEAIMEIIHRDISPGGIVLQHNFQSNARLLDGTIEALPRIIDDLQKQGYKFVTMQTLLNKQREELQKKEQQTQNPPAEGQPNQPPIAQPPAQEKPIDQQPVVPQDPQ